MRDIQPYTFEGAKQQWAKPPVDNVGYLNSEDLLAKPDKELKDLIAVFEHNRFDLAGWRNYQDKWRTLLGFGSITGKTIMDFGCGVGLESLLYTQQGNKVFAVDISPVNLKLAQHVAGVHGVMLEGAALCSDNAPYFPTPLFPIDVFHANGVLHHTPRFREILLRVCDVLSSDGWIQLMLYSDKGWEWATGNMPKPRTKAMGHPDFDRFVTAFDGVGFYADWFSEDKINWLVGDFLELVSFDYVTRSIEKGWQDLYSIVKLRPR